MESPHIIIKKVFNKSIKSLFPEYENEAVISISNPNFGDYQCNSGMLIFSTIGKSMGMKSPREIGEKIKQFIMFDPNSNFLFDSITVAPQGFITVKISTNFLCKNLQNILQRGEVQVTLSSSPVKIIEDKKPKVLVDFSSPNIAKEMHVGHLRSTIIGDTICRIFEYLGYEVLRINHVGDWGTQFGMLIEYLKEQYPDYTANIPEISDLQEFYRSAKKKFDQDPEFKLRSQKSVVKLQGGDPTARAAWKKICEISRTEFQKVYDRLNIHIEEYGESFYNDLIPEVILKMKEKGIIQLDDGAQCIFTSINNIPLMAVKSDGGYGYDSTDLAAIYYRLKEIRADWVIYITDSGQEEHFLKIFEAAKIMEWHNPPKTRLDFVGFGVIQGEDGKKFKTRSGDTVKLVELLDEAVTRAYNELINRRLQNAKVNENTEYEDDDLKEMAKKIGYAAVKYFDMKQNRLTNYKFSFDRMLDPKGNTAVYLLYAYARICAIFRRSGLNLDNKSDIEILSSYSINIQQSEERLIALKIIRFPEVFDGIIVDLHINRLTEYCYELCELVAQFYTSCRILDCNDSEIRQSRLALCFIIKKVLLVTLNLLGIEPLEKI
ncbi:arginyl-tRNA synthetase family protein [Cryptosporidium andersoni]|uniref:arginine--tRNA ligase n=1 Tax=Cryptosporidium andersoni TaxID=117008 RepID=A0A1J4MVW6_9CRYT|nr:arginyl-tRNA synthetase family protein [Cryptosporidium andersoni]